MNGRSLKRFLQVSEAATVTVLAGPTLLWLLDSEKHNFRLSENKLATTDYHSSLYNNIY